MFPVLPLNLKSQKGQNMAPVTLHYQYVGGPAYMTSGMATVPSAWIFLAGNKLSYILIWDFIRRRLKYSWLILLEQGVTKIKKNDALTPFKIVVTGKFLLLMHTTSKLSEVARMPLVFPRNKTFETN